MDPTHPWMLISHAWVLLVFFDEFAMRVVLLHGQSDRLVPCHSVGIDGIVCVAELSNLRHEFTHCWDMHYPCGVCATSIPNTPLGEVQRASKLSGSFKISLKLHRSPLALGGMARGRLGVVVAGQ